jgi:hypothetical protein
MESIEVAGEWRIGYDRSLQALWNGLGLGLGYETHAVYEYKWPTATGEERIDA